MVSQVSRQFVVGFAAAVALVAAAFSYAASVREERIGEFSPYVSKDGAIARPTNYRDTFQHIGTSAVATKPGQPVDELHNVYSRPEDVRAYRRDGKFPDGAVLVNEVTRAGSETLTSGLSHRSAETKNWFIMVKDSKGRFPGNALWGDGWGWAMFKPNDPAKNVATDYSSDCRACHVPARKDGWVYVREYPALRKGD
jgi:Cytochrome P460